MSRLAKKPIHIPDKVEITVDKSHVTAKGPHGELSLDVPVFLKVDKADETIQLHFEGDGDYALWGTYHSLLKNMIMGVNEKFKKKLEVNGVGYKAALKGKDLEFALGYSHPVVYKAQEGIEFEIEKNVITVSGVDKQKVGAVSAEIRGLKKPEPYKGKGIKYSDEVIIRKIGKKAKTAEA